MVLTALLLFAVQLAANLSTASTLSASGYAAARRVASRTVDRHDPAALGRAETAAERDLRASLRGLATVDHVRWHVTDTQVHLRVIASTRRVAPRAVATPLGLDHIERDLVVLVEAAR